MDRVLFCIIDYEILYLILKEHQNLCTISIDSWYLNLVDFIIVLIKEEQGHSLISIYI